MALNLAMNCCLTSPGGRFPPTWLGCYSLPDEATSKALNNLIFADIASAQEMLDMVGRLSHIDLIVEEPC